MARPAVHTGTSRGAGYASAQAALAVVLAGADEPSALAASGLRLLAWHAQRAIAGRRAYSVVAAGAGVRLRYWRLGRRVALDHSIYRAGQWVDVYGDTLVGRCTGAWALTPAPGAPPVALTAGHCTHSSFIEEQTVKRGFAGHPADRLGAIALVRPGGLDAATVSLSAQWGVAQQVERGAGAPLTAIGWVPTRDQRVGDRVCFAGRTSGADRCGRIVPRFRLIPKYARCTDIPTDHGDSGGPVYTPAAHLATHAVGIVIKKGLRFSGGRGHTCYAPIQAILEATGYRFPTGPLVRGPGVPQ